MTLITRQGKGSKLTIQEMDGNLTYLESLAQEGGDVIISGGTGVGSTVRLNNDNNSIGDYSTVSGGSNNIAGGNGLIDDYDDLSYNGSSLNGTYNNISPTLTSSGLGTDATFNFEFIEGALENVFLVNRGLNYVDGDTLTFDGTLFDGVSGDDDVTLTIDGILNPSFSNSIDGVLYENYVGVGFEGFFNNITPTSTLSGLGSNATFDVLFKFGEFQFINVENGGFGYVDGDTLTFTFNGIIENYTNITYNGSSLNGYFYGISPTSTSSGLGTGATFYFEFFEGNLQNVFFDATGLGYVNGDTLTFDGTLFGGVSGDDDVTMVIDGINNGGTLTVIVSGITERGHSTVSGGLDNIASNCFSTISGGRNNDATGRYSTVGGGRNNVASGKCSTVGGGTSNYAIGYESTISGGEDNVASGDYSTVGGGYKNTASGGCSTVGGGYENTASGGCSTVGGGTYNCANGSRSTVGGGAYNCANGTNSTIGGGSSNASSGNQSTVGGGINNTSSGYRSTIGGGRYNTSSGNYSTVSGGGGLLIPGVFNGGNIASGNISTIGGGRQNRANGNYSTISGGYGNTTGNRSTIGGGGGNTASGEYSTIGGGDRNTVCEFGFASTIAGGRFNVITNTLATIGGGTCNMASGCFSTVGGGRLNTSSGFYSIIGGGGGYGAANIASGCHTGILGGRNNSTNNCNCAMIVGSCITADRCNATFVNNLSIKNIPTSSAGLPSGSVWRNGFVLNIVV